MSSPSSSSRDRRLRFFETARRFGRSPSSACSHCIGRSLRCFGMPEKSLRCAECYKRGRSCTDIVWKVDLQEVDRVRKEYREAHESSLKARRRVVETQRRVVETQRAAGEAQRKAEDELDRVARLWERLEELNQKADEEATCLVREIEEEDRREAEATAAALALPSSQLPGSNFVPAVASTNADALALFAAGAFDGPFPAGEVDLGSLDALLQIPLASNGTFSGD